MEPMVPAAQPTEVCLSYSGMFASDSPHEMKKTVRQTVRPPIYCSREARLFDLYPGLGAEALKLSLSVNSRKKSKDAAVPQYKFAG